MVDLWCNVLSEQNNEDPITMQQIQSPVIIKHDSDLNNFVVYDRSTLHRIINHAVETTIGKLSDFGYYDEKKRKFKIMLDDSKPRFMSRNKVEKIAYSLPLGKSPFTRTKFSINDIISLKEHQLNSVT